MKRRVLLVSPARVQLERARRWWVENRQAAADAFDRELVDAFEILEQAPRALQRTTYRGRGDVHAYLLPVSRYRLFFTISDDERTVIIIEVRHARRRPV